MYHIRQTIDKQISNGTLQDMQNIARKKKTQIKTSPTHS